MTVPDEAQAAPERVLAEDEVLLSSGKIARLARTLALHGHRSDMLMVRAGYTPDPFIFLRVQALLAVTAIDGQPQSWPAPKKREIERLLARYSTADVEAIMDRYRDLNTTPQPARGGP